MDREKKEQGRVEVEKMDECMKRWMDERGR